jgi:hypothetical protein
VTVTFQATALALPGMPHFPAIAKERVVPPASAGASAARVSTARQGATVLYEEATGGEVGVRVADGVKVAVEVGVREGVEVAVGVRVAVAETVVVEVGVRVGVEVDVRVAVGLDVAVCVAVGV